MNYEPYEIPTESRTVHNHHVYSRDEAPTRRNATRLLIIFTAIVAALVIATLIGGN